MTPILVGIVLVVVVALIVVSVFYRDEDTIPHPAVRHRLRKRHFHHPHH